MERQLQVRILSWRAQRAALTRRGLALVGSVVLCIAAIISVSHQTPASTTFSSNCIPYTLHLPRAWRAQSVPMPDCGAPVLFDEFHLFLQGEQLTLSVQAVTLQSQRLMNLLALPRSYGSVTRYGGGGQLYVSLLERQNGITIADAAFTRAQLSYLVTVESAGTVNPEPVLIRAMDGWGDRPRG
ncbi:MAG TPA: hypothetical protein VGP33_14545 [Chloroflexota bacterium]|nr:hypothetical protein [Chloroflexota bacterium]